MTTAATHTPTPASPGAAPTPGAAPGQAALSITDFLTDGSLAALCGELSHLLEVRVELLDQRGHAIARVLDGNGAATWRRAESPSDLMGAAGAARTAIVVGGTEIGSIVMADPTASLSPFDRERTAEVLRLVAQTTAELCQSELEARHRIREVAALARMSATLTRATSPQRVLDLALELALDTLGLDAGSIMLLGEKAEGLLSENEEDLTLASSRNLSKEWLDYPRPLSKDRLFDRIALSGQLVISEDLSGDDRILIRDRALAEGLAAAIHVGLVVHSRPLGVMRLYSRTRRTFDESEKRVVLALGAQAATSLERSRLLALEQEEVQLQRQLSLAADVQRRMLPRGVPNFPTLDMAARYVPSFELGGDFYDFIDLNGHMGVVVGDVVGKGIAAALLMSSVRSALRAYAQDLYDLDEIVRRVNQALCRDTRDFEFSSLWYGVIDPHKLRLTYCSAGHEPPLVVRMTKGKAPTNADMDELSVGGMVVGIDPAQRYQRALYELRPGDVLFAYTDGLPDATSFSGERFGKARIRQTLIKTLTENPRTSAADILERMLWEVRQFAGLSKTRSDDRTVVAVRVRER